MPIFDETAKDEGLKTSWSNDDPGNNFRLELQKTPRRPLESSLIIRRDASDYIEGKKIRF